MDMNLEGLKTDASNNDMSSLESQNPVTFDESDVDDESQALLIDESDVDDESQALLSVDNGGLSKNLEKTKRKVQWLDSSGDELVQIMEFQPSDASDSEEEDSDSCICRIINNTVTYDYLLEHSSAREIEDIVQTVYKSCIITDIIYMDFSL